MHRSRLHCSPKLRYLSVLLGLSVYTILLFIFGYISGIKQWYDSPDELEDIPLPELDARGIPLVKRRYVGKLRLNPGWKILYPTRKIKRIRKTHQEVIQGPWSPPLDHYNRTYRHSPGYVNETVDLCATDQERHPIVLFVFVESAPSNLDRRTLWRTYWGSKQEWLRIAFVVGLSASESLNKALIKENDEHHDLIILNYTDTYSGLTTKTATMLEWISIRCSHAHFVLKTDDDVMVNFSGLRDYMDKLQKDRYFYGGPDSAPNPLRAGSKWKVSYQEYPFEKYPKYVLGSGILMSMPTVLKFQSESKHIPIFPFEDVFLGFCAKAANISLTALTTFQGFERSKLSVEALAAQMARSKVLLAHGIHSNMIQPVWYSMQKRLQSQVVLGQMESHI